MSEGSVDELRAPNPWDRYEGSEWKWSTIQMQEVVYSDLPSGAEKAIEEFIAVDECGGADFIEEVRRLDPQTIEITWFDDEGDAPHSKDWYRRHDSYTIKDYHDDAAPTRVSSGIVETVRGIIQDLFGEHWRVNRKPDDRRGSGVHPQRVLVRRASHQRFKYIGEEESEYLRYLHGTPENAPEGVEKYGDLSVYPEPAERGTFADVYLYEADSGTVHLLGGYETRGRWVFRESACQCGLTVQPEIVIDADGIEHYGEFLRRQRDNGEIAGTARHDDLDPLSRLGEDLCGSCWRSYSDADGKPPVNVHCYAAVAGFDD